MLVAFILHCWGHVFDADTRCALFHVLRLIHVGKALQEQHWLFENLMAQVEDKRLVVGDIAKQIEAR